MAKKEAKTDLWVARQLDDCGIRYDAQGSDVKEIDEALKSASKRGTGKAGFPEYTAVVGDFVIVIEDKADMARHMKLTETGIVDADVKAVTDYAVNGAYFYAKHIAQNSPFKKVFAVGVSGDAKHHAITPLWVDDREGYKQLEDIESFTWFSEQNIEEYYTPEKWEAVQDAGPFFRKARVFAARVFRSWNGKSPGSSKGSGAFPAPPENQGKARRGSRPHARMLAGLRKDASIIRPRRRGARPLAPSAGSSSSGGKERRPPEVCVAGRLEQGAAGLAAKRSPGSAFSARPLREGGKGVARTSLILAAATERFLLRPLRGIASQA